MKIEKLPLIAACVVLLAFSLQVETQTVGVLFTVDSNTDTVDATIGDRICADAVGRCTLRAAVHEANANPSGGDIIIFALPSPSVISLTQGQMSVTGPNIYIVGPGARRLTVQRDPSSPQSRVFSVTSSNLTLRGMTIRNGSGDHLTSGGAIATGASSTVRLTEVALLNNSSAWTGGAVLNGGNLTIMRSLIAGNSAFSAGGAIRNDSGATARIVNSTITNNHCAAQCGAIANGGTLILVNDTISHNTSVGGLYSIVNTGDPITILNTILGPDNGPEPSLSGAFNSLGNNIVTDARGSTGFANGVNNDQVSENDAINPLLGELTNNGGHTDTRPLLSGSPAVNAGNSCILNGSCALPPGPLLFLRWDQRILYFRPAGGTVDVGSFEFGANMVTGTGSFTGRYSPSNGQHLNSIVIHTDTETNEKKYAVMGPFGTYRFQNHKPGVVYVQEIRSKRNLFGFGSPHILPVFD